MKIDRLNTNAKLFSVKRTNTSFEWIIENNALVFIFGEIRREVKKLSSDKWTYIAFSHEAGETADNFSVPLPTQ